MLADLDPEPATPADRVRPLRDGRYELKAVIDADCHQGWSLSDLPRKRERPTDSDTKGGDAPIAEPRTTVLGL